MNALREHNISLNTTKGFFYLIGIVTRDIDEFTNSILIKVGISNKLMKSTINTIFFDKCFAEGVFSNCFKIAKVKSVFKSGYNHDQSSYRPISLLAIAFIAVSVRTLRFPILVFYLVASGNPILGYRVLV